MARKEDLIRMGYAVPFGIKGEAELRLLNTEESILEEGMEVMLYPTDGKSQVDPDGEHWKIARIRFGNKVIALFEGIKDRTHLEALLPFEIYVSRDQFPEIQDDEVYLVDLVGMKVISYAGEELGVLEGFADNGMQYLLEIRMKSGELLTLPYVEAFFPHVNLEEKTITMVPPEYTE